MTLVAGGSLHRKEAPAAAVTITRRAGTHALRTETTPIGPSDEGRMGRTHAWRCCEAVEASPLELS